MIRTHRSLVKPVQRLSKTHTWSVIDRACWYNDQDSAHATTGATTAFSTFTASPGESLT